MVLTISMLMALVSLVKTPSLNARPSHQVSLSHPWVTLKVELKIPRAKFSVSPPKTCIPISKTIPFPEGILSFLSPSTSQYDQPRNPSTKSMQVWLLLTHATTLTPSCYTFFKIRKLLRYSRVIELKAYSSVDFSTKMCNHYHSQI